jgi:hypothetical protein
VNTATRATEMQIDRKVGAARLAIVTAVLMVGLLTGLVVGKASLHPESKTTTTPYWTIPVHGPQSHIGQMALRFEGR